MVIDNRVNPSPHAAPKAVMYAYPWALHDAGPDRAFEEMRSCGIDAVQLALSYHVGTYLTPRGPGRRVHYGDHGALYFDARAALPIAWPFDPPVSKLVTGPEYANSLLEAAERHDLRMVAWVVYLYNHALARSRPELAVVNVFGDPSGAHLCPANPAVRSYARALTRAVIALGHLDGFHAESLSYHPYDHGFLNRKSAIVPGRRARHLLSLCLCRHCRRAAHESGIGIESLAGALRSWTDDHLNRLPDETNDDPLNEAWPDHAFGGELKAFMEVRTRQVVTLQHEVLDLAAAAGLRTGSDLVEAKDLGIDGAAAEAIVGRVDELRVKILPTMTANDISRALAAIRLHARDGVPVYGFYQLGHFRSEQDFGHALELAAAAGLRHHRFYEFSLLSRRQIDWLRGRLGGHVTG